MPKCQCANIIVGAMPAFGTRVPCGNPDCDEWSDKNVQQLREGISFILFSVIIRMIAIFVIELQ